MKNLTLTLLATVTAFGSLAQAAPVDAKAVAAKIDALVKAKLEKEKITPLAPISDEVFVRRVYLDVIGRIPTLAETSAFLASTGKDKRSELIDSLLASDGYVHNMFNYWGDVLRFKSSPFGVSQSLASGYAYGDWLRESLKSNKPYDQMVREMVSAKGKSYEDGAIGYYIRDYNMPLDNMAVTTQVFLGTSMVCAQCHNHPFDKWSQMDYYQMAAHTYGMTTSNGLSNPLLTKAIYGDKGGAYTVKDDKGKKVRKGGPPFALPKGIVRGDVSRAMTEILRPLRYTYVMDNEAKNLELPHDYQYSNGKPKQVIEPMIPASFSKEGNIVAEGENSVVEYASWMTSKENPRFTTVVTNRLWKKLMGQALIEPLDELTDSSVPSNPQLMSLLEETMRSGDYDMKGFLRAVLNSSTYQRAAYTKDVEPGEAYHFPGPLLRRMTAEQIWDSMVALYKPDPDSENITERITGDTLQRRIEWLDRALNGLTPKELQTCTIKVAQRQKELSAEVRAAQLRLTEATKNKDEDAMREAKAFAKNQRVRIDEAVDEIVFDTGMKKFAQMVKEGKLKEFYDDAEFVREVTAVVKSKKDGGNLEMEEALEIIAKQQRTKHQSALAAQKKADAEKLGLSKDNENLRESFAIWERFRESTFARAADLRHPAPNGHFLREFGQSDKELPENSNDEASVSQALMLLNGRVFGYLMNPHTEIARALTTAKKQGRDAVVDAVYLSLLSRKATREEKALLREVSDNADSTDRGDVLWTVLNTRQFFFIQ
jgi:hypothetical protein